MKLKIIILFSYLLLISIYSLHSQSIDISESNTSLISNKSPLFGKDIIINDKSYQDQRFEAICSAYNGWLFAVYSHPAADTNSWQILRSMDNGITWSFFWGGSQPLSFCRATNFSIIACGNDLATLKVFVSFVVIYSYVSETRYGVERFNGQNGNFEDIVLSNYNLGSAFNNGSIASDYQASVNNATPYSFGILYTRTSLTPNIFRDSLIFVSSSDGGITLNNRKVVSVAKDYTHKFAEVALAYGYSPGAVKGNYFVTWEEKASAAANVGHIYTSHTTTGITSQFSTPVCLDSLDVSSINKGRNPKISCQVNNVNNDSSNLTEIILYEKFLPGTNSYDVIGCCNLQAVSSNYFNQFGLATSGDNEIQPDITFNSYDNFFNMTYYNSTIQSLPLLKNSFNMTTPNLWTVISNRYNDSSNLINPYPKITVNPILHECANLWIAERDNGNGVVMFDALYSTYTNIPNQLNDTQLFKIYPNPCNTTINIRFEVNHNEKVIIALYSMIGKHLKNITNEIYSIGRHNVIVDVSDIPPGSYFFSFKVKDYSRIGMFIILR